MLCRPKPWLSMKRQAPTQASPLLSTPANVTFKPNQLRSYQSSPEEASPVPSPAPSQHPQSLSSDNPIPYSSGLFGRQHAAKRQHLPDGHASVSASPRDSPNACLHSTPTINQRGASSLQPSMHVPDALDRFNARRGSRLSATTALSKPAQQHLDALDRFNARKGFTQQTSMARTAVAHSGGASSNPAGQVHTHSAPTDPHHAVTDLQSRAKSQMHALLSSSQPTQAAAPQHAQHAQQQQQTQRGLEALDRVNRRRGFKTSSNSPSPSTQGAATTTAAEHMSRLHPLARQQAQRPLHELASPHPHPRPQPHRLSCQQASEGVEVQGNAAEDSQQSQCTSVESQRVTELRSSRPAVPLVQGFAPSHTFDALDRVNSLLLARRKSRTQAPAAGSCRASASPDASVSSAHAQTVDTQVTSNPVGLCVDEVKASSCGQIQQDDTVPPSSIVSSRMHPSTHKSRIADMMHSAKATLGASRSVKNAPVVKKRMRAFDNDDDGEDSMGGSDILRKRAKADYAVAHDCHTTGRGAQHGTVFNRLAQQCA